MAAHKLLRPRRGWDMSILPPPYNGGPSSSKDPRSISEFHDVTSDTAMLHAYAARAVIEFMKGNNSGIALVKVGEGSYATETEMGGNGESILFHLRENGKCQAAIKMPGDNGRFTPFPTIGGLKDETDLSAIFMALLARVCDLSESVRGRLNACMTDGVLEPTDLIYFSDAIIGALTLNNVKITIPGGNFDLLTEQTVKIGALRGEVLCGTPSVLNQGSGINYPDKAVPYDTARKEFETWRTDREWTEAERALIPTFPPDYPVLPESIKICKRYVATHEHKRPMTNIMWRGVTSYGKSTGVELIAAMLDMPLLRLTCHSTMETQDFLATIVPVSKPGGVAQLPTFEEMACDPESAYYAITGKEQDGVTAEECLAAYAEAYAASRGAGGNLFKMVESNFVRALEKGYLLEIQECSRIKDPGVLVGINEYNRAGAIIPLVDGSFVRRHPDALVIFTDNVGYQSCRPIDPSVLRRMAFILDSYEIPKETALERVVYNTGFEHAELLSLLYDVWDMIRIHCADRDITEGTISLTELETWAQCVKADGYSNVKENCIDCVISKATSVIEEQKEIIASVLNVHLN